ncbi:hypothetical protein J4434_02345 [Candidatus Woesearchaeota archaeon]|nr:hypothetical protein [Candidatus Woesearchaeota archaeon]
MEQKNNFILSTRKVSLFYITLIGKALTSKLKEVIGKEFSQIVVYYKNSVYHFILNKEEYECLSLLCFNKIMNNKQFVDETIKDAFAKAEILIKHCKHLDENTPLTNEQLVEFYKKYVELYTDMYSRSFIGPLVDRLLFNKLKEAVELRISDKKKVNEYLQKLTREPQASLTKKSYDEILKIVKNNRKINPYQSNISYNKNDIKKLEVFMWLGYDYESDKWDMQFFEKEISKIQKNNNAVYLNNADKEFENAVHELNLNDYERFIANTIKQFSILREKIKEKRSESFYYINQIFSRLKEITEIEEQELKYILPEEIDMLCDENLVAQKKEELTKKLKQRYKESIFLFNNGTSKEAGLNKYVELVEQSVDDKKIEEISVITGVCSSIGRVSGIIKIINNKNELDNLNNSDKKCILVARMTMPELVFYMDKVAGIITDDGGSITCHAAILAREFNVPCLTGAQIATRILKEGDFVELNASENYAKILKQEQE